MDQEYVLRTKTNPKRALKVRITARRELSIDGCKREPLTILRVESNGLCTVQWGDRIVFGLVRRDGQNTIQLDAAGERICATLRPEAVDAMEQGISAGASANGTLEIRSPIPGLVKWVNATQGDKVQAGQKLIVLEAMKMENDIVAPHNGILIAVDVASGQAVAAGALLARVKVSS